jgi:peptidoglycan hydrolase-like protein with peptidoglycan-binding domain
VASSAGGIGFLVVVGLAAIAYSNAGWGSTPATVDGDQDFDFGPTDNQVDDGDELATCDGVLVVESPLGSARVPGDTGLFDATATAACEMQVGEGDEDAVAVLQNALARCHGEAVDIDGQYGPQTAGAVMAVQSQAGVARDGEYGPATLDVMRWPVTGTAGTTDCVAGVSQAPVVEDASPPLPPTR